MPAEHTKRIGILTSGGDAAGMNAAVRATARTALARGMQVYAIYEGYQGMVDGGDRIHKLSWDSVGGILHRGGTVIGTARCPAFRSREGRLQAARNLLEHEIDSLVVIGGDGSLTGANLFRQEWPGLLAELVASGAISQELADRRAHLAIVGLVGSIDNDMAGTDMTIGADTALHRITEAVDAISSTAASHQRTFVVEVMGRHCGYLALMGALATGADWVLIPENPPNVDNWEATMCDVLRAGRENGRRDSIVIVAEGAQDRTGKPISSDYVKQVLEERLGEDTRVTILGHVQRGGAPSAFDRTMSTLLGHAAVDEIAAATPDSEAMLIGMRNNRITRASLMRCVEQTRSVAEAIGAHEYERAMELRGGSFRDSYRTFRTLVQTRPHQPDPKHKPLRLGVLISGGPAAGMNTAVRAAVRLGIDKGHAMLGIRNGFQGLIDGDIDEMDWMSVSGWASMGGAELGTSRKQPSGRDFYAIARAIEQHQIDGLLMLGGLSGYQTIYHLYAERENFPAFNIPMICLPATINNNLPGTELSIGADTALNNIIEVVDKIKQSAVAARRCFVVEVMGRDCGYLALMSGMATGAERVYLNEEGVTLRDLEADLQHLIDGFRGGKRLGLMIRNEHASQIYTTGFMAALFEEEGRDLFEVRQAILGHLQQGGDPSPFDRIQATRLAARCVEFLLDEARKPAPESVFIGLTEGQVRLFSMADFPRMVDEAHQRPKTQWWLDLRPIAQLLAQPGPEMAE
ncbi:MAG TPA: 6-phosphofructokinase [Kouleothrix sp.]|uniref:6-phosphofructokinase n=1 Tax=Kouleothrix sp. TaxID=2779161 RepID=UPI002C7D4673|nr:6-phosphofructokinase [Kouleothrix sp.]HRC75843.1 6-phosphofructokinase [Kouleothrix sp.]